MSARILGLRMFTPFCVCVHLHHGHGLKSFLICIISNDATASEENRAAFGAVYK